MKAKTKEKVAKGFALVVVLIMILQVFLPLFSSNVISTTQADVTADSSPVAIQTGEEISITPPSTEAPPAQ